MFSIFKKPKVEQPPEVILPETQYAMLTEQEIAKNRAEARIAAICVTHDLHESNRKYVQSKNKKPWT